MVDLRVSCPISFFIGLQAIYLWHSLTTVGLFISIHEDYHPNYLLAGQMDEHSQMSPQSANGPSTYDEALKYFELSVDKQFQFNIAGNHAYGPSPNAQGVPVPVPHIYHLPPQGYSTQPIYHNHSQHPHMIQTANYSVAPHEPYPTSSPGHYPHQHAQWPPPNSTFHPASHSQAHAHLQSTEGVQSRWVALQAEAVTWPPDTIEPLDSTGESPLMSLVGRSERKYYCQVPVGGRLCDRENTKKDRILAHIRNEHLHFRPLACGGQCGFSGWLVNPIQNSTRTPAHLLAF